jgi:hypothetical protein
MKSKIRTLVDGNTRVNVWNKISYDNEKENWYTAENETKKILWNTEINEFRNEFRHSIHDALKSEMNKL